MFDSIENLQEELRKQNYIADRTLATTLYLSTTMKKPIFLEGEAGVGKTDVAKVLAQITGSKLIRLQCYEGLDVNTFLPRRHRGRRGRKVLTAAPDRDMKI